MNYQTWDEMQSIARDVLGDDVKKMLLSIHDDNGLTKLQRQLNGRWTPYFQIERYAAHNRRAIDLQLKEKVALELLAHISRFFRMVDYANVVTPESVREPVENVVQAMLGKLREKLDPNSEVTPEQLEKARYLAVELQKSYLKPVTPEQVESDWQETRRICMKLAPHLPEPDRAALLALLPPVDDAAPVVGTTQEETTEQRQDRRLQACIDAGLPMHDKKTKFRLPNGVGKVAGREGVTRQAFSTDVKAALDRHASAKREGTTVHRT